MKPFYLVTFSFLLLFFSCSENTSKISQLEKISTLFKNKYAPDSRVAIFNIEFESNNGTITINGETDSKEAYQKLLDSITKLDITVTNNARFLPDVNLGERVFAVANNSVINIRSAPKHSAELGTQGLLGMSVKVLEKQGDFYRIQTPDYYISWVDKGGIQLMNESENATWNASKKIIFTDSFGYVYKNSNTTTEIISDITLGGVLKYLSEDALFFEVKFPDNRTGFIQKKQSAVYNTWLAHLKNPKESIEISAKKMIGFPYLWGGTSAKGIDCSGFTKMVYLMNGFSIPRDASQQIYAGTEVDKNLNFKDLEKGDLLFFGKEATENSKQKVTHVGIWLGNFKQEFIHSSGNVHISSMDENQPNYDAFNKNRYLGSRRYLGVDDVNIVALKK